jgi:hypothetical protein
MAPHRETAMRARILSASLFLLFAVALAPAARAAKSVTVAELEQILEADRGQSDGRVAGQLSSLTLTERLSSARLEQGQSAFPGRRTRAALLLLADESAFLPLPPTDVASGPPPPLPAQGKLFDRVIGYVNKTTHNLPNFLATRTTSHFEDSLQPVGEMSSGVASGSPFHSFSPSSLHTQAATYLPLHFIGKSSVSVAYREGAEIATGHKGSNLDPGLTTRGEFGPILGIVVDDAVHSSIVWGYWQSTATGRIAVFRYQVPVAQSHYLVEFRYGHDLIQTHPAYHGEIAVDPVTGSILRLSIVSEMAPPFQIVGSGIVVEYSPIVIGDRTYICPVRGVALSKMPVLPEADVPSETPPIQTHLNDVAFTNYHRFRADARILSPEELQHLPESRH